VCPHIEACVELGKDETQGVWGGELKGWASKPSVATFEKWSKKQDKLSKDAERLGLNFEYIKRAIGY